MDQQFDGLQDRLRRIPAVDQILQRPAVADWIRKTSRGYVVSAIQELLQQVRDDLRSGECSPQAPLDPDGFDQRLDVHLRQRSQPVLEAVVNATGVILHTNLGRAPLSEAAQKSLSAVSAHYTNLEYDLKSGSRSHRDYLVEPALREILDCEAATVVNNNAAAVFLILNTLARGKEVIVSRGELIEIGGSFRIPDIMERSGARLREVGTTNKTRIGDYESAVGPDTALLLRIHPSNYRIRGFTERPALTEMVDLARRCKLPLVEDIGSGCLVDLRPYGIPDEPRAQDSIAAGVDLICFSADKLMGGPQAGIIAGARGWIELIRKNPLMRTYRVEKLIYGALEATLAGYRTGRAVDDIPVLHLLAASTEDLRRRSRRFLGKLRPKIAGEIRVSLAEGRSVVGGGSCPDASLDTVLLVLASSRHTPNQIEQRLRSQHPPILVRLEDDRTLIDLRTVFPAQEKVLLAGLVAALT